MLIYSGFYLERKSKHVDAYHRQRRAKISANAWTKNIQQSTRFHNIQCAQQSTESPIHDPANIVIAFIGFLFCLHLFKYFSENDWGKEKNFLKNIKRSLNENVISLESHSVECSKSKYVITNKIKTYAGNTVSEFLPKKVQINSLIN